MNDDLSRKLIEAARGAREHAYAPYSDFRVGAAVMSDSGTIFVGCNVENASYGATLCAERVAIAKMVAAGERHFSAIAVFVDRPEPAMPCGICRQVIVELGRDADVIAAAPSRSKNTNIARLLPDDFRLDP